MTYEVDDHLILDSRRAAWLPRERVLAIADLHLGYAWAHRKRGQLLPILPANETVPRLLELQRECQPRQPVVLGDLVHRADAMPALEEEVRDLIVALLPGSELVFLLGNHDRGLQARLIEWQLPIRFSADHRAGAFLLVHGNEVPSPDRGELRVLMGHEHPAISIGDGVTTSQKCPCFLLGDCAVILPAFSRWAAGTDIRSHLLMSETARRGRFTKAVAICGERLLPIRL